MEGLFDSAFGLPLHPLVVHAVVVLLPLAALSMAAAVFWGWWRSRLAEVSFVALTVAVAASVVAKEAGEALTAHLGTPVEHAEWADRLVPVAILLWLVSLAWVVLRRRPRGPAVLGRILGPAVAVLALAVTALTVLVGHTGAQATWTGADGRVVQAGAATSIQRNYGMEQVAQHRTPASCWIAVDDGVYDVTTWIAQHPGGPDKIKALCGTDATSAFHGKHGTGQGPNGTLARYRIGSIFRGHEHD